MSEKVIGYILLVLGIVIALLATLNIIYVFTGRSVPVTLFKAKGISFDVSSLLPREVKQQLDPESNTETELISSKDFNFSMNVFAHVLLGGFIMNFGFRLATLGVQLLRPIHVDLKSKSSP